MAENDSIRRETRVMSDDVSAALAELEAVLMEERNRLVASGKLRAAITESVSGEGSTEITRAFQRGCGVVES